MKIKKLLALVLTLCVMISAVPSAVFALDDSGSGAAPAALKRPVDLSEELGLVISQVEDFSEIEALNTVTDEQRNRIGEIAQTLSLHDLGLDDYLISGDFDGIAYSDLDMAAGNLRESLVQRDLEMITVPVYMDAYDYYEAKNIVSYIFTMSFAHTGIGNEGDYLRWHWASYGSGWGYDNGVLNCYYIFTYYTSAEQETLMNTQVPSVLESLNLEGKTDYQKFFAIYEYITHNITYDYANLEDDSYTLKYSAYAALIDKTAVCQGYANLLYRMLLTCGIDCRLIAGIGGSGDNSGPHAWNIVRLGNLYYNVDSTWDAGGVDYYINGEYDHTEYPYDYMLKCNANFPGHLRNEEYETEEFNTVYPMADSDFDPLIDDIQYVAGVAYASGGGTYFETLPEAVAAAGDDDIVVLLCDASGEGFAVSNNRQVIIYLGEFTYTVSRGNITLPASSSLGILGGALVFDTGRSGTSLASSGTLALAETEINGSIVYSGGEFTIDASSVAAISIGSGFAGIVSISKSKDSTVTSIPDGYEWTDSGERDVLKKIYTGTLLVGDYTQGSATYSVDGNTVTVSCLFPCKVGYEGSDGKYIALPTQPVSGQANTYTFAVTDGSITEVVLVVNGDSNLSGDLSANDAVRIALNLKNSVHFDACQEFAADSNLSGDLSVNDAVKITLYLKGNAGSLPW